MFDGREEYDYADSGVAWLGNLPSHWKTKRIKYVMREVSEKNHPDEQLLSVTQKYGVVPRDELDQRVVMPTGQLQSFKLVRENDFVISLRSFQGGIELSENKGLVSPAYTVLRLTEKCNPRFIKHLFKSAAFISELNVNVTGIRQGKNIDYGDLAYSRIPLPTQGEQSRIVTFLDEKTAEIDAAIEKKRRLIDLLNEQKAILINRAVTKGLNLDAPMKDSGIDWIGEIPAHWEVKAIKRCLKSSDYGLSISTRSDGKYKCLGMGNLSGGRVTTDVNGYLDDVPKALFLKQDDILFNRTNSFDLVGKCGIFKSADEQDMTFASYLVRLRVARGHLADWLNYVLMDNRLLTLFRSLALRSLNQANLNPNRMQAVQIAVPPEKEQIVIAEHVASNTSFADEAIASASAEISALSEYKQTLIANAVTGKIKV